jgi:hypothetical protein
MSKFTLIQDTERKVKKGDTFLDNEGKSIWKVMFIINLGKTSYGMVKEVSNVTKSTSTIKKV